MLDVDDTLITPKERENVPQAFKREGKKFHKK
jgi:hypothetical protein